MKWEEPLSPVSRFTMYDTNQDCIVTGKGQINVTGPEKNPQIVPHKYGQLIFDNEKEM